MSEQQPDTDERSEPAGTPSRSPGNLTDRPLVPGDDGSPRAVPGVYEADDDDKERGTAVKPGN